MLEDYMSHVEKMNKIIEVFAEIGTLYLLIGFGFLIIKFIKLATEEGMIFGFLRLLGENQATKPIYLCEYCMASVWGFAVYSLAVWGFDWLQFNPLHLVLYLPSLSGFMKYFDEKRERLVYTIKDEEEKIPEYNPYQDTMNGYEHGKKLGPYDN